MLPYARICKQIGLLATCGIVKVAVVATPTIGVMSTGDELVEPGKYVLRKFFQS
jgi:molybdopterin biosynthesis enzyme